MKIKLEGREYEFKANGAFMKKYQDMWGEPFMKALFEMSTKRDLLTCAKLVYCGIKEELSFDEWIDSFESPLFIMNIMEDVFAFITREITPTVESEQKGSAEVKKKK